MKNLVPCIRANETLWRGQPQFSNRFLTNRFIARDNPRLSLDLSLGTRRPSYEDAQTKFKPYFSSWPLMLPYRILLFDFNSSLKTYIAHILYFFKTWKQSLAWSQNEPKNFWIKFKNLKFTWATKKLIKKKNWKPSCEIGNVLILSLYPPSEKNLFPYKPLNSACSVKPLIWRNGYQ